MRRRADLLTLTLASVAFVSLGLPDGLLGVAWPSIRATYDLPLDALGAILSSFAIGYFVASAANGRVLARLSVGIALSVSCALTGVCLLIFALAPGWAIMVAFGALLGAGGGTIDATLNVYATRYGARALNWLHAAFGVGAALGPLLMTIVLGSGWSWTLGYLLVGVAQLALAVAYAVLHKRFVLPSRPRAATPEQPHHGVVWRVPAVWLSVALFAMYTGFEVTAGQWSFSLLTEARGIPATQAGVWVSAYWASLTVGRLLFGALGSRVAIDTLLRSCMLLCVCASVLLWLNIPGVSTLALPALGLLLAPIFPLLIARTPERVGPELTADTVGLEVAAAVLGGAAIPTAVGVLAARSGLEVIGPALVVGALAVLTLHEVLLRLASEPRKNAISRTDAAVSSPPRA